MSATYYEDDGVTVVISDRGMGLWRAENDNEIMRNLRRTPTVHTAILIGSGLGIVMCCIGMFVEALIRNS
jgi:signal transduction histidine kinase